MKAYNTYQHQRESLTLLLIFLMTFAYSSVQSAAGGTAYVHRAPARSAVTYTFSGGRFGDNLLAYLHAKWFSYFFDIPLLYRPFEYSDQLVLHEREEQLNEQRIFERFEKMVFVKKNEPLIIERDKPILYVMPYFPECLYEHECWEFPYIAVDWRDKNFQECVRPLVQPRTPILFSPLPDDGITVAVHVRKGGGFDGSTAQKTWPLKFPNDDYYIEQLKYIANYFPDKIVYVYFFTDDPHPRPLMQAYYDAVQCPRMLFIGRGAGNHYTANVLYDFFALMRCDCLIRADSNFTIVASKLANYKLVISPAHHYWAGERLVIDQIAVEQYA